MICLQARGLTKDFPGVRALDGVDFDLEKGEIHAIVGENGAGKSTFVKILAGVYGATRGEIAIDGEAVSFSSPREAARHIGVVHQERELVPFFSGTANLFLGQELRSFGFLKSREMRSKAHEFMAHYGLEVDLDQPVAELGSGQQEMLTILKVLFRSPGIVIFDEPTAALSVKESAALFSLIRDLRDGGASIIYISHHLPEVLDLADRVTVLRNGKRVSTVLAKDVSEDDLIRLMIAKDLGAQYPKAATKIGATRLEVRDFSVAKTKLEGIDFSIASGEIVGFAGLVGAGRTELAKALFEGGKGKAGKVLLDGRPFAPKSPRESIARKVVMIPEDRRGEGLFSYFSVGENLSVPRLPLLSRLGFRDERRIEERGKKIIGDLAIKVYSTDQSLSTLSGGNQQKVSLGKWFDAEAALWIFDEPTQGIDVETKSEIYAIMERLASSGAGIWFISSDLRELTEIADRIYVMRDYTIAAEYSRPFSTEQLLSAMLGKRDTQRTET